MIRQVSDIICGNHSNIPLCCILWYMNPWARIQTKEDHGGWINWKGNYKPCPECMIRYMEGRFKPQEVKRCDCNGGVYNFGDPMGEMLEDQGKLISVSRTSYERIRPSNRDAMRTYEDFDHSNVVIWRWAKNHDYRN